MRSPLFMMMGMMAPIMIMIAIFSLLIPAILYVIARWRQNREPLPDPQLGIKFALGFFRQIGFQMMLLGGFLVLYAILGKSRDLGDEGRGDLFRVAFGLLIPSLIVWGVHNLAMQRTNHIQFPGVDRLWAGYNLLSTGIVGFVSLILVFESLLSKHDIGIGRQAWALALVYCSAWAAQGVLFLNRVLDTPPSSSMSPPSSGSAAAGGDAPWSKPLS
ncbi:MAG TPA: hypothetical protein VHE35_13660 [Kofleriaceae bacterium]|nr:hypothetical protein [Kofleriaceae bacterium]